jgi:hypothetical protein
MPLVVVDTSVSLPATLSEPGGLARKFMVLLAFGALKYRAEHLQLEGERPVQFTWKLSNPMPEELFEVARSVAVA